MVFSFLQVAEPLDQWRKRNISLTVKIVPSRSFPRKRWRGISIWYLMKWRCYKSWIIKMWLDSTIGSNQGKQTFETREEDVKLTVLSTETSFIWSLNCKYVNLCVKEVVHLHSFCCKGPLVVNSSSDSLKGASSQKRMLWWSWNRYSQGSNTCTHTMLFTEVRTWLQLVGFYIVLLSIISRMGRDLPGSLTHPSFLLQQRHEAWKLVIQKSHQWCRPCYLWFRDCQSWKWRLYSGYYLWFSWLCW